MSEISLRDYLAKLYTLLEQQSTDQVILHSRHILKSFPRNVTVYRVLGRAMVAGSRWQEGEEMLRRVLSVYPDDYVAHRGMSEIYQHANRTDEAIWHLERAYEQDPNNEGLIDTLRKLYREYRNIEQHKVQLTSGAVARQYAASALYDQAVDTLQRALEREPERVDLRLLMAETLWNSGYHIEAAETAMEVLRVLPECYEANRIMTLLWLGENRPSDAQRFLSRIEDVDPYAALELATGQRPTDSAFMLEELDYERVARQEMASARPSWLTEIGEEREPQVNEEDWLGGVSYAGSTQSSASALTVDKSFGMDVPDDWLSEAMNADSASSEVMPDLEMLNTGALLGGMDTPASFELPAAVSSADDEMPAMDDIFGMDADVDADAGGIGLEDWLAGLDASAPAPSHADETLAFPPDELAQQSGADKEPTKVMARGSMLSKLAEHEAAQAAAAKPEPEIADSWSADAAEPSFADLLAMDSAASDQTAEPNLADMWGTNAPSDMAASSAGGYGFTGALDAANWQSGMLGGKDNMPMFDDLDATPAASTEEAEDPLAWLRGSDVELTEGGSRLSDFVDDDEMSLQDMDAPSPTAWMAGYGSEMLVEESDASDASEHPEDEEVDPLAWLRGSEVEILDHAEEPTSDKGFEFSLPVTPPPATPRAEPAVNWASMGDDSFLDEALNMESLSLSGDYTADRSGDAKEEDVLDWATASDGISDTVPDMDFADDYAAMSDSDVLLPHDQSSWGSSDDISDEMAAASLSDITDWQGDMSDNMFNSDADDDSDLPTPDWLEPESDAPKAESDADAGMEWLEEDFPKTELSPPPSKTGLLQWLSGQPPVEGAATTSSASDEPTPAEPEPSFDFGSSFEDEASEDDGGFEWLSGGETDSAPAASGVSWMSELEDSDDADDDFSSLFGSDTDTAAASESMTSGSAEDWLPNSDLPPAPDAASEYGFTGMLASTAWGQDADEEPESVSEFGSADTSETDWLAQLRGESSAEVDEPAAASEFASDFGLSDEVELSSDEFNFMNAANVDEEDEEEPAPDWLSELQTDSTSAPTSATGADEFDFMSDAEEPASEFDFMSSSESEPSSGFDFMSDADAAPASEFDFISALNDSDEGEEERAAPVSAVSSGDDWLSELRLDSDSETDAEDVEEAVSDFGSELSFGSKFESAEDEFGFASDPDAAPAGDMPDWLSELQSDTDAEADLEPEDEALPEPTASDFATISSSDFDDEEEDEFDFMTEAGLEPAPADDMPDWLSELQADAAVDTDEETEDEGLPEPAVGEFGGFNSSDFADEDEEEFGFMTDADLQPATSSAYGFEDDDDDEDFGGEFDLEAADEAEAFAQASDQMPASGDMPDWLTSMGIGSTASDEAEAEAEAETIGGFDWSTASAIDEAEAPAADDEYAFGSEFAEGEELEEQVLAQEVVPPPAKNAPDWLNAMVPGLDLDFDAPEDEPIEQEFLEEDLTHRARVSRDQMGELDAVDADEEAAQEFNWLSNMVDEEVHAVPPAPPQPDQLPVERRRFTFSKPPLWMRGTSESGSLDTSGAVAAGLGASAVAASIAVPTSADVDVDEELADLDFDDGTLDMDEIDDWVKDDTSFPDMASDSDLDLDTEFGLDDDDDDLDMLDDFGSATVADFDDGDDDFGSSENFTGDDDFDFDSASNFASNDIDDDDDDFDLDSASDFDASDDDDDDFELPDYLR